SDLGRAGARVRGGAAGARRVRGKGWTSGLLGEAGTRGGGPDDGCGDAPHGGPDLGGPARRAVVSGGVRGSGLALEGVGELIEKLGVGLDRLVGVRVGRHVDD